MTPENKIVDVSKMTPGQLWSSLRKSWKGYRIAKSQGNSTEMKKYAVRIIALQKALAVPTSTFDVLQSGGHP